MPRLVVFQKDLGCCLNRIGKNSPYVAGIILYRTAYTLNIGNSDIILLVEKHLELVSGGEKVHSFLVDFCEIRTGMLVSSASSLSLQEAPVRINKNRSKYLLIVLIEFVFIISVAF